MKRISVIGIGRWGKNLVREFSKFAIISKCVNQGNLENIRWLNSNYPEIPVTANIEDVLKAQPTDTLPRAPDEYVFKKKGLHGYLVYMLADIVRSGTQARRFDFDEKIPENLQRNILDQGKVKNIENYGSLISYDVGLIKPTPKTSKMVFYTPDFPYLLKQIRWLNFTENLEEKTLTANINYDFLQIKLFMVDTNQILKDYGPPEYSFIMALGTKTFNLLNSIQNEKDFY